MKKYSYKFINSIISLLAVATMWLAWFIASVFVNDQYLIPSVGDTFSELISLLFGEDAVSYWTAFGMTFLRSLAAWLFSGATAAVLAALSACNKRVRVFVKPFVAVIRILPVMAITLMLLRWSSRSVVPVIVSSLTLCPLMYAQFMAAYDGIDGKLLEMARVYNLSARDRIFLIYLPQMLPSVLSQAGANIALSLKVAISAEVLASSFPAIGRLINDSTLFNDTAQMFAITISMLIAGGVIEWACSYLTRITDRWAIGGGSK